MKKIAIVALMFFAFPVLASFAATASEKPVTGPKDVFTTLNDLPNKGDGIQDVNEEYADKSESVNALVEAMESVSVDDIGYDDGGPEINCTSAMLDYYYEAEYASADEPADFRSQGVVYDEGTRYTWYSENVLPGAGLTELNENGRTVNDEGFVTDGEGRIAVASSDYPIGTELDTPFGPATVYDTGCPSGTIDVYTSF